MNPLRLHILGLVAMLAVACGTGEITNTPEVTTEPLSTEVCDNSQDDDADDLVDCDDADCATHASCPGGQVVRGQPGNPPFKSCGLSTGDRSDNPVDMVWVLDGSPSMGYVVDRKLRGELGWIQSQLNDFADRLIARRADIRLVVLGAPQICVEQPLGGPNCGDGERFRHIKDMVGSHDALPKVISLHDKYKDFLRPDAQRFIVVATDDDTHFDDPKKIPAGWDGGITGQAFDQKIKALAGGLMSKYVFNSIVGYSETGLHPNGCRTAQARGTQYIELAKATGGRIFPICNPDWEQVFELLGNDVASSVNVPCSYPVQVEFDGTVTDPNFLHVEAEVDGRWQVLGGVASGVACGDSQPGWYVEGAQVHLCPSVCSALSVSRVRVYHGCPVENPQ